MGNNSSDSHKKLFDKMDTDRDGRISLYELVVSNHELKAKKDAHVLCSLFPLYHFDFTKDGMLTWKEFGQMEAFVERILKQLKKQDQMRRIQSAAEETKKNALKVQNTESLSDLSTFERDLSSASDSEPSSNLPLNVSAPKMRNLKKTGPASASKNSPTKKNPNDSSDSSSDDDISPYGNQNTAKKRKQSPKKKDKRKANAGPGNSKGNTGDNDDTDDDSKKTASSSSSSTSSSDSKEEVVLRRKVKRLMNLQLLPSLTDELGTAEGRKKFLEWLFKLCDIHQNGTISLDELEVILVAIQEDNIDLNKLLFDNYTNEQEFSMSEEYSNLFPKSKQTDENQSKVVTASENIVIDNTKQQNEQDTSASSSPSSTNSESTNQTFDPNENKTGNKQIHADGEQTDDEIDELDAEHHFDEEDKKKMEEFKKLDLVRRIMREYDTTDTEDLTKEEFMKLGDLILSLYEEQAQKVLTLNGANEEFVNNSNNNKKGFNTITEKKNLKTQPGAPGANMENFDNGFFEDEDDLIFTTKTNWEFVNVLGRGSYGLVRSAINSETHEKAAVKRIKKGNVGDLSKLDFEIDSMQKLHHPNVVGLYEIVECQNYFYLVMELCGGGTLFDYLEKEPFDEPLARYYFHQLVYGLQYCHQNGVCHRDLRLENLLLNNYAVLKISDFGHARIFQKGWDFFSSQLVGSLYHLAPEQIKGNVYSGEKLDIWSLGIILYCFVTAQLPFCSPNVQEMFRDICDGNFNFPKELEEQQPQQNVQILSNEVKDLIRKILTPDSNNRPTLEEIIKHPWMQGKQRKPQLMQYRICLKPKEGVLGKNMPNFKEATLFEKIFYEVRNVLFKSNIKIKIEQDSIQNSLSRDGKKKSRLRIKCINPKDLIKFSVTIVLVQSTEGRFDIKLRLREGETGAFLGLYKKLKSDFLDFAVLATNEQPY